MSSYFVGDPSGYKIQTMSFQAARFFTPKKFRAVSLDYWPANHRLRQIADDYIRGFPSDLQRKGLYLWSDHAGTGKTSYAIALVRELISCGRTQYLPFFISADDLFEQLREIYNSGTPLKYTPLFQDYMRSSIIILDDVGVEKMTKFVAARYYYLMNAFWSEEKPIIVTSKFSPTEAFLRADPDVDTQVLDSLLSRVIDMMVEVRFPEKDRRV
jgi:DNA replication protein DnaC